MFIELTILKGQGKFIGNVNLLQGVGVNSNGDTYVIGWNNNGGFEVVEDYEEVIEKILALGVKVGKYENKD